MGKNNKSIKILRGSRSGIVSNKNDIPYGQPVFDNDDNYLFVGSNSNTINQPITTNRIEGYYADNNGISQSSPSDKFKLGPSSDGESFELNSRASGDKNFKLTGDIIPSETGNSDSESGFNLGSENFKFKNIYADNVIAHISGSITTDNLDLSGYLNVAKRATTPKNYFFNVSNSSSTLGKISASSLQIGTNSQNIDNSTALSPLCTINNRGAISAASLSVSGNISAASLSVSGNISAASLSVSGNISAATLISSSAPNSTNQVIRYGDLFSIGTSQSISNQNIGDQWMPVYIKNGVITQCAFKIV